MGGMKQEQMEMTGGGEERRKEEKRLKQTAEDWRTDWERNWLPSKHADTGRQQEGAQNSMGCITGYRPDSQPDSGEIYI